MFDARAPVCLSSRCPFNSRGSSSSCSSERSSGSPARSTFSWISSRDMRSPSARPKCVLEMHCYRCKYAPSLSSLAFLCNSAFQRFGRRLAFKMGFDKTNVRMSSSLLLYFRVISLYNDLVLGSKGRPNFLVKLQSVFLDLLASHLSGLLLSVHLGYVRCAYK